MKKSFKVVYKELLINKSYLSTGKNEFECHLNVLYYAQQVLRSIIHYELNLDLSSLIVEEVKPYTGVEYYV